jgi:hypothetical protein
MIKITAELLELVGFIKITANNLKNVNIESERARNGHIG